MKLTYFGHSCFAVETCGNSLLFDPFIRANELARGIDPGEISADFIFLSHGHFDHVSDAVEIAKRTGAKVVGAFEVVTWIEKQGVATVHPMNHGGAHAFEFGRVKFVSALHSSVMPDGSYGGNPGGFVVESGEGAFYYAGDTALTLDMQLIADEFDLRFAVLPIGDNFTMGARDAARAAGFVKCRDVVGVHYDTFPPIRIDKSAAAAEFERTDVRLHLPAIGGSVEFGS